MQKIQSATSISKFTFFLTDDLPCLIEHDLALCGVIERHICLNFRAKKKSPHGGLRMGIPQASMRGFIFCSKIEPDLGFFNTALFLMTEP